MRAFQNAGDIIEFYRFRDWYIHLGVPALFILAHDGALNLSVIAVGYIQVILMGMFVFSFNDYSDARWWGEKNNASGMKHARFLAYLPLLVLLPFAVQSFPYSLVLLLLFTASYLYQGPPRLKENYLASLAINSLTFPLIYVYPSLLLAGGVTPVTLYLGVLFTAHMLFFETAHQIEHQGKEPVYSVTDVWESPGRRTGYVIYTAVLLVSLGLNLYGFRPFLTGVTGFFAITRLLTLSRTPFDQINVRGRWHKFHMVFEASAYLFVLAL